MKPTRKVLIEVFEDCRKVVEGVGGPDVRSLGHDVAQDLLDPRSRGRLLLQAVDVDGPGQGQDDHLVQLLRISVENSGRLSARKSLALRCNDFGVAQS